MDTATKEKIGRVSLFRVAVLAAALDARCQDHEIAAQQLAWQALENLRRQPAKMISTALDVPNRAIVY